MKPTDCTRWAELTDRLALEEDIGAKEYRFVETHAKSCRACGAEEQVWQTLGACLRDDSVAPRVVAVKRPLSTATKVGAWTGAAAVAAAALLAYVASTNQAEQQPLEPARAVTAAAQPTSTQVVLVAGDVDARGTKPSAGASLKAADVIASREGRACFTHGGHSATCLLSNSSMRVLPAKADRQRVRLERGTVLARQSEQAEASLEVSTKYGTIVGLGAKFAVAYTAEGGITVHLEGGRLRVHTLDGQSRELTGSESLQLGRSSIRPAENLKESSPEHEVLTRMDLWDEATLAPLEFDSNPSGARVSVSGVDVGTTPLSMLVSRGAHDVRVEKDGFEGVQRVVEVLGAERVVESVELQAKESAPEVASGTVTASPADLLARAKRLRSAGRFSEAATTYSRLIASYPSSSEASVTYLSLAELQLSQLGAPASALRSFDGYLQRGGPLRQEASYGKIRALRALGRSDEARALATRFVARYPKSGQAVSLRRWLDSSSP